MSETILFKIKIKYLLIFSLLLIYERSAVVCVCVFVCSLLVEPLVNDTMTVQTVNDCSLHTDSCTCIIQSLCSTH